MFIDDAKKNAMTILSRRKSDGTKTIDAMPVKPEVTKDVDGSTDERHVAAEEMMAAHREGSAEKMSQALQSFIDIHMNKAQSPEG